MLITFSMMMAVINGIYSQSCSCNKSLFFLFLLGTLHNCSRVFDVLTKHTVEYCPEPHVHYKSHHVECSRIFLCIYWIHHKECSKWSLWILETTHYSFNFRHIGSRLELTWINLHMENHKTINWQLGTPYINLNKHFERCYGWYSKTRSQQMYQQLLTA